MIHIFCALPCEAQPLIQFFRLTELKEFDLFRLYQSKNTQISLTITGVGKINMAAAVSYQHACIKTSPSDIWLNIGIAGHTSLNIGEACLINKIIDEQDNSTWYPQIIFKPPCETKTLITLNKPSSEYQDSLFDMEASAFYQIATRLGTAELIHCLKIISDNKNQPASSVNANKVKELVSTNCETIHTLIETLTPLSEEIHSVISDPEYYQYCIEKWHFTQSEQHQLKRFLRQWPVRFSSEDIINLINNESSGKKVITRLRKTLYASEFVIHD